MLFLQLEINLLWGNSIIREKIAATLCIRICTHLHLALLSFLSVCHKTTREKWQAKYNSCIQQLKRQLSQQLLWQVLHLLLHYHTQKTKETGGVGIHSCMRQFAYNQTNQSDFSTPFMYSLFGWTRKV